MMYPCAIVSGVAFRVVVGRLRVTRVDANVNLAHHRAVPWRVYTRSFEAQ